MKVIVMDGRKIESCKQAHDFLKEKLVFPDYYGGNLDALYDCLGDIAEQTHLVLCHYDALKKNLGMYATKLLKVITDATAMNHALTVSQISPRFVGEECKDNENASAGLHTPVNEEGRQDITRFLDEEKRIKIWPSKQKMKICILEYLSTKFEYGRTYTEKEVNAIIDNWHTFSDYFLLRRGLIDYKLMSRTRNGASYWREEQAEY